MKRILKFGGAMLALGMLLASCNMITADSTVSGNSTEQETSNINSITIGVEKSIGTNRTILPADWTAELAGKLTYVLKGKKTNGGTDYEPKATFSYDQLTNGTAKVDLELTKWDLLLTGYMTSSGKTAGEKGNEEEGAPCLERELTEVDFSKGATSVTFDLKPVENTQATGSVNVSIAWLTDRPKRLELGIYPSDTSTQAIVAGTAVVDNDSDGLPLKKTFKDGAFADAGGNAHKASMEVNDKVKAKMYKFAAVFYDDKDAGKVIGYYIDWLYVDGGNLSKATINYGDKFNTVPDNPTWLAVKTFFKPEALASGTAQTEYLAEFHWNDNSTNETGFELVITEKDREEPYIVNPAELAKADFALKADTLLDGRTASPLNNNMDAGSTSIVLKLETQKLYTAKIRAINEFTPETSKATGEKDFCKNLNRTGDGQGRSYAPIVGDDKQFGMFTVNYTLDEYSVVVYGEGPTDKTAENITNYVVGYNYSGEQQNLMTDDPQEYPHISKDANVFDYWTDTATSSPLKVIEAKNIKNLTLEPNWKGVKVRVSVTFPSYADATYVKIAANRNEGSTYEFEWKSGASVSVDAGASFIDGTVAFELTNCIDGTEITGSEITHATNSNFTWTPTTRPTSGYYRLQITGKYKAGFESDPTKQDRELTLCGNIYIKVEN